MKIFDKTDLYSEENACTSCTDLRT